MPEKPRPEETTPISSFWKGDMHTAGKRGAAARTATMAAKTHCKRNHEYTKENTGKRINRGKEVRFCIQCRENQRAADRMGPRVER